MIVLLVGHVLLGLREVFMLIDYFRQLYEFIILARYLCITCALHKRYCVMNYHHYIVFNEIVLVFLL